MSMIERIQEAVKAIPGLYRGPGGAIAVLKDGELVAQHTWGYADIDRRIPLTDETLLPICSITKHMVCMTLMEITRHEPYIKAAGGDVWKQLSQKLREYLGEEMVDESDLKLEHLANMASGLRDYWALTVLCGAKPDDVFSVDNDGPKMLKQYKSFHFPPNSEFSYSNINFYIIGRIIEDVCGEKLEALLPRFVFGPAGMHTASLSPDTARQPGDCIGYEFDEEHGFMVAKNRMQWSGDAGAIASLKDMIAFERYADKSLKDPESAYSAIAKEQHFNDGTPTKYGFGLMHGVVGGVKVLRHSGGLRGYRLQRVQVPEQRLSVVVLFNHEADVGAASEYILKKALGISEAPDNDGSINANPEWFGAYLDSDTQLGVSVKKGKPGKVDIKYAGTDSMKLVNPDCAESKLNTATLSGNTLTIERRNDHRTLRAERLKAPANPANSTDYLGTYRCQELDSALTCTGSGDLLYGFFDGCLGKGPVHLMRRLSGDIWQLSCPRGLDAPAPGDWTLVFSRNGSGSIDGVTMGCWLARKLKFTKTA